MTISEEKAILKKILENTPYTDIYDESPEEIVESSPDQQEEAPATEFETPSNPFNNLVDAVPPNEGTCQILRDDESHPFTWPFEFEDDLFLDVDFGNTLQVPSSTSSYASNSYMRHQKHWHHIEGESIFIEYISMPSPSMPTLDVSSKSKPRGELETIPAITISYPSLAKNSICLEKESAPRKAKDFIDEHGGYVLNVPSTPCSYEKSPDTIHSSAMSYKTYNPLLLSVHKNFERFVVDAFVYYKFCRSRCVLA